MTANHRIYETTPEHAASYWGSGNLEVLATPCLVAFMENAAFRQLEKLLPAGETSVGTAVSIQHLAASAIGQPVTVTITAQQTDGRRHEFELEAYAGDKLIGRASHSRLAVDRERFLTRLADT